jgi:light-regulated signal transduction histidine kinase (bacteriophytochrome)
MVIISQSNIYDVKDNGIVNNLLQIEKQFAPFKNIHTEEDFQGTCIGLASV